MTKVVLDITTTLDGFVAGPNQTLEEPLGTGGNRIHEWVYGLASWRESHGLEGGESNPDDEIVAASRAATGAVIMGRRMFSGGAGPWEDDPNAGGWWGDESPFGVPAFVLTHHEREPLELQGAPFLFVTDGIQSAVAHARTAAGDRDILLAGGANVAQQALRAGLVDEVQLHIAPLLFGDGVRLLDGLGDELPTLEPIRVVESPKVTHIRYRVVR
jgi:dihydrofolate reductase